MRFVFGSRATIAGTGLWNRHRSRRAGGRREGSRAQPLATRRDRHDERARSLDGPRLCACARGQRPGRPTAGRRGAARDRRARARHAVGGGGARSGTRLGATGLLAGRTSFWLAFGARHRDTRRAGLAVCPRRAPRHAGTVVAVAINLGLGLVLVIFEVLALALTCHGSGEPGCRVGMRWARKRATIASSARIASAERRPAMRASWYASIAGSVAFELTPASSSAGFEVGVGDERHAARELRPAACDLTRDGIAGLCCDVRDEATS